MEIQQLNLFIPAAYILGGRWGQTGISIIILYKVVKEDLSWGSWIETWKSMLCLIWRQTEPDRRKSKYKDFGEGTCLAYPRDREKQSGVDAKSCQGTLRRSGQRQEWMDRALQAIVRTLVFLWVICAATECFEQRSDKTRIMFQKDNLGCWVKNRL